MQKRRERIERWRAERKKREAECLKKEATKGNSASNLTVPQGTLKKWSLEDDSEDEDKANDKNDNDEDKPKDVKEETELKEEKNEDKPNEEEVDPLDEFMKSVQAEVRQIKFDMKKSTKTESGNKKGQLVIVTGVAKAKESKNKGELIEQNQDGLEYSSEEEQEDLKDTAASIANKQRKELAKIDHNEIVYAPFRKNFYVEVPEIAKMTHEEVEAYKEELEGIRVKGELYFKI